MNRKTLMPLIAGLAAIGAVGCGSGGGAAASGYVSKKVKPLAPATVSAGQEKTYFPFAEGSQWTFDAETTRSVNNRQETPKRQEITYHIDKVSKTPNGGEEATFSVLDEGGKVLDREVWRADSSGLYQVSMGKTKLNPLSNPQLILPFPVKQSTPFKWSGSIASDTGEIRKQSTESTVLGPEEIDTAMGPYNALAIESKGKLSTPTANSQTYSQIWFVPGVGMARLRMEVQGVADNPKNKAQKVPFAMVQVLKLKDVKLKQ